MEQIPLPVSLIEKILPYMKINPLSISEHPLMHSLQPPAKPLMQKKSLAGKPRLKNFFEMAKETELERKHKRSTKKSQDDSAPCLIETALLEKTLIHHDSLSSKTLCYEPLESTALVEAVLEKISYQMEKGIEKTSIFFGESCKNPFLKGSEIHITCYDTDPMRFHLDFFSSAQGIVVLTAEMGNLKEQLQKKFPNQFFCLANPCLNTYSKKKGPSNFSEKVNKNTKKSLFY